MLYTRVRRRSHHRARKRPAQSLVCQPAPMSRAHCFACRPLCCSTAVDSPWPIPFPDRGALRPSTLSCSRMPARVPCSFMRPFCSRPDSATTRKHISAIDTNVTGSALAAARPTSRRPPTTSSSPGRETLGHVTHIRATHGRATHSRPSRATHSCSGTSRAASHSHTHSTRE